MAAVLTAREAARQRLALLALLLDARICIEMSRVLAWTRLFAKT